MTKQCFKCGEIKPLDEFYRHPQMADGHLGKCKTCARADAVENRTKNLNYYAAYEHSLGRILRRRKRVQGYTRAASKDGSATRWRQQNPRKAAAHNAINHAIGRGAIERQPCEVCGNPKTHAHHPDYSKPLDVMWLCARHHADRHIHERHGVPFPLPESA
jgi:hypothetical protein